MYKACVYICLIIYTQYIYISKSMCIYIYIYATIFMYLSNVVRVEQMKAQQERRTTMLVSFVI